MSGYGNKSSDTFIPLYKVDIDNDDVKEVKDIYVFYRLLKCLPRPFYPLVICLKKQNMLHLLVVWIFLRFKKWQQKLLRKSPNELSVF